MRWIGGVLALLGCAAAAEAQEPRGAYAGASVGYFSYDEGGESLGAVPFEEGGDSLNAPISDGAGSYRLVGGYQFNSVYALEAGWGRSGRFGESFSLVNQTGDSASLEFAGEYEITTLRFIAFAPLSNFGMFGGAGYYDAKLDATVRLQTPGPMFMNSAEITDDGLTAVGGFQFELDRFALRGEYEWFDADRGVEAQSFNFTALVRF